ncbi:hypothetical protein BH09MYX1_BH09MYX1_04310 [soil metagenome]
MWVFTSVEFPSDNQDLWRANAPTVEVEILSPPAPTPVSMADVVLESLTHTPPAVEAVLDADVEVDDFDDEAFANAVDDSIAPPPFDGPVPLESMVVPKMGLIEDELDASATYLQALKDVAIQFGTSAVFAETLDSVLGREPMCVDVETGNELVAKGLASADGKGFEPDAGIVRVAAAWQSAFRGDEPDFSVCSAMLDEWSADIVAKLVGRKELTDRIRRELRFRGIAAFGLVEAA